MNETTLTREVLYEGRILRLERLFVELADGHRDLREIIRHDDAVCAAVMTREGEVVFVRQYRKAVERALLEIPAGLMNAGESHEAAVRRELEEEIGFQDGRLHYQVPVYASPGFCDELMHLYVVTEARLGDPRPDEGEHLEIVKVGLEEAVRMALAGELGDAKSVLGVLLLARVASPA